MTEREQRRWAGFCHLTVFVAFLASPVGSATVAFVLWRMRKNKSAFVDAHGKEALNYQISCIIYVAATILGSWLFDQYMFFGASILLIIHPVHGSFAADDGKPYRYPISIRFVR